MSLGGALAGLGRGVANLANKYIDEELAQQRAEFLADLQFKGQVRLDEYQLSEGRQEKLRTNATQLTLASKAAERQAAVDGAGDGAYQDALDTTARRDTQRKIDGEVAVLDGTADAKVRATNKITEGTAPVKLKTDQAYAEGMLPHEIAKAEGVSKAQWGARAEYDKRMEGGGLGADGKPLKLPDHVKLEYQTLGAELTDLRKTINKGLADGTLATSLDKDGRNKPQYDAYQQLLAEQRMTALRMNKLLEPFKEQGGPAADPLGLRGDGQPGAGGGESAREKKLAAIMADMKKNGTATADVQLEGGPRQRIDANGQMVDTPQPASAPAKPAAPSLFDRAITALAPDLNAHARPLLSRTSWSRDDLEQAKRLLADDNDQPRKPLKPELRAELEKRLQQGA
jgi:hypothetical protein